MAGHYRLKDSLKILELTILHPENCRPLFFLYTKTLSSVIRFWFLSCGWHSDILARAPIWNSNWHVRMDVKSPKAQPQVDWPLFPQGMNPSLTRYHYDDGVRSAGEEATSDPEQQNSICSKYCNKRWPSCILSSTVRHLRHLLFSHRYRTLLGRVANRVPRE